MRINKVIVIVPRFLEIRGGASVGAGGSSPPTPKNSIGSKEEGGGGESGTKKEEEGGRGRSPPNYWGWLRHYLK